MKLTFPNKKGETLVGLLVEGTDSNTVFLCHGYLANKEMCHFPLIAEQLRSKGIASFRFDHPCAHCGDSERSGPFEMGNHEDEADDIHSAVAFLRSRGRYVSCILGHSKGGTNVLTYAAKFGDVPSVIMLAGRFCVREGLLQRYGQDILETLSREKSIARREADGFEWSFTEADALRRASLPTKEFAATARARMGRASTSYFTATAADLAAAHPPQAADEPAGLRRMLCLHGRGDATIPWEESRACASASGADLVLIDGDHNFNRPPHAARAMAAAVVAYCQGGDASAVSAAAAAAAAEAAA